MDNPEAALAKNNIRDVLTGNRQVDLSDARRVEALGIAFLAQPEFQTNSEGDDNNLVTFKRSVEGTISKKDLGDQRYKRQPILFGFPQEGERDEDWGLYVIITDPNNENVFLPGGNVRLEVTIDNLKVKEYSQENDLADYWKLLKELETRREELIARVINNITGEANFDPSLWM